MQRLMFLLILILSVFSLSCEEDEFSIEDEINSIRPISKVSIHEYNSASAGFVIEEFEDCYAERGYLVVEFETGEAYFDLDTAKGINLSRVAKSIIITY